MSKPYDPGLRKTEHGSKLYQTWKKINQNPHCEEWEYFPTFYEWAMQMGYEIGAWLKREDVNGPYSPQNCFWYLPRESSDSIPKESLDKWNKTVNRIRKHYGMPPLRGTKYGD
jgi:hypothetical protein